MSQQPYDPASPGMSGFTVADGFSVIPPKRPMPVTVASTIMLVLTGLTAIGGLAALVAEMLNNPDPGAIIGSTRFDLGVWLFVLAIGLGPCAMLVRNGSDGGRLGAFTVLGAAAIVSVGLVIQGLMELPLSGRSVEYTLIQLPIVLLGAALTVTPLVLLAGSAASQWFWGQRRDLSLMDPEYAGRRPMVLTIGLAFVALTALFDIAAKAAYLALAASSGDGVFYLLGYFGYSAVPLLAILAATVGLAVGSDLARLLAFGVCGFYCFSGIRTQLGAIASQEVFGMEIDLWFVVTFALGLLAAVSAGVALFALFRPQVSLWFGQNRHGAPTPPDDPGLSFG